MDVVARLTKYHSIRLVSSAGVSLVELTLFLALLITTSAAAFFFAFQVSNTREEAARENIALAAFLSGASGATTYMRSTGEFEAKIAGELATTLSMNAAIANETTGEGRFAAALLEMEAGACEPKSVSFVVLDNRDANFRDLGNSLPISAIKKTTRRYASSNCERRQRFFDVLYRLPNDSQSNLDMSAVKQAKYEYFQPISGFEEAQGSHSSDIISGSSSSVVPSSSSSSSEQSSTSSEDSSASENSSSAQSSDSSSSESGGSGGNSGGGGGGGGCFIAGTPILLASGREVSIEDIKVGDQVVSYDLRSKQYRIGTVTHTLVHPSSGHLLLNGDIGVTSNHRVLSQGRWRPLGRLRPGKSLTSPWESRAQIESLELIQAQVLVYNFEVFPYRNYVAGGLVVHNSRKDDFVPHADVVGNYETRTE